MLEFAANMFSAMSLIFESVENIGQSRTDTSVYNEGVSSNDEVALKFLNEPIIMLLKICA